MAIDDKTIGNTPGDLMRDFGGHHEDVEAIFRQRYTEVESVVGIDLAVLGNRALLIGAYFLPGIWL